MKQFALRHPRATLFVMRVIKLLWWTVTLQLVSRLQKRRARLQVAVAAPRIAPYPDLRGDRRVALIIDYRWPRPDQDSGSVDAINLIDALATSGYRVLFTADAEFAEPSAYRDALEEGGMTCISATNAESIDAFLDDCGQQITLAVLSRVYSGGTFYERVRAACPNAAIVFNTVDLHFLRETRHAELEGDIERLSQAQLTRRRELALVRDCDATLVVSSTEQELLQAEEPGARIFRMPLARTLTPPRQSFTARHGIGFIGGFEHAPNVDAVRWFLADVWPALRQKMPDARMTIVGRGLPDDIQAMCTAGVLYLGPLPRIDTWLESLRATVAPLRFGAGAKGKVASSLAAGVPCVATPVAVEGMGLTHDRDVMVATTPQEFVTQLGVLLRDQATWERHSRAAFEYAQQTLGPASVATVISNLCQALGEGSARPPH